MTLVDPEKYIDEMYTQEDLPCRDEKGEWYPKGLPHDTIMLNAEINASK